MTSFQSAGALALCLVVSCAADDNNTNYNPGSSTLQGDPSGGDSDTSGHDCAAMCGALFDCDDVPDRDSLWATEADCLATCDGVIGLPFEMAQCLEAADSCTAINDCVRCLEWGDDIAFCRDSACDFLVDDCGFGSDTGQCTIDCEMIAGGAMGECFRGAGSHCWKTAAAANDCSMVSDCPTIHILQFQTCTDRGAATTCEQVCADSGMQCGPYCSGDAQSDWIGFSNDTDCYANPRTILRSCDETIDGTMAACCCS